MMKILLGIMMVISAVAAVEGAGKVWKVWEARSVLDLPAIYDAGFFMLIAVLALLVSTATLGAVMNLEHK